MADKIKEALFSSLASFDVQPIRILDLYAGSGAIGIEALSRGGEWCDFVEWDRRACAAIRDNLRTSGFQDRARIRQTTIDAFLKSNQEPYDFVILDPPYADPNIIETLASVSESASVQDGTIVVLGHWPRLDLPDSIGQLAKLRERCHGDSCFSIFELVYDEDG